MLAQGWSASEFAAATGIYVRTLSRYLAGERMSGKHLMAASDVLELPPEALVDDDVFV